MNLDGPIHFNGETTLEQAETKQNQDSKYTGWTDGWEYRKKKNEGKRSIYIHNKNIRTYIYIKRKRKTTKQTKTKTKRLTLQVKTNVIWRKPKRRSEKNAIKQGNY